MRRRLLPLESAARPRRGRRLLPLIAWVRWVSWARDGACSLLIRRPDIVYVTVLLSPSRLPEESTQRWRVIGGESRRVRSDDPRQVQGFKARRFGDRQRKAGGRLCAGEARR